MPSHFSWNLSVLKSFSEALYSNLTLFTFLGLKNAIKFSSSTAEVTTLELLKIYIRLYFYLLSSLAEKVSFEEAEPVVYAPIVMICMESLQKQGGKDQVVFYNNKDILISFYLSSFHKSYVLGLRLNLWEIQFLIISGILFIKEIKIQMLIDELANQCKDKGKIFQKGRVFLVQENLTQHCDFLTVSWIINELEKDKKVTFVAFRQNYAHYLSLSKKIGKSIEQYLKTKQLKYYECFESSFCQSQLPLTQTSPSSYTSPPTMISRMKVNQFMKMNDIFQQNCTVIVDAISFLGQNQIVFKIYEEAINKNCKIVLAGAMEGSQITQVFRPQTDLFIKLQNDVGSSAKFKLSGPNWELNIHWKHVQGKFQLTQYIKL